MRRFALALLFTLGSPAWAETSSTSQILVSAVGTVKSPPDMVTVGFTLRGEGATSDAAVTNLRNGATKMSAGLSDLLGKATDYHSSTFSIAQVRSKDCDASNYGQQRLSTGPCAIVGYVATMPVTVDTPRVADAGTLTGVISRLGGVDAGIRNFWLRDESAARRRAMQAALDNGHDQARLIAEGSRATLGPILRVQDANYQELSIDMAPPQAAGAPPPSPPPPPPPPVRVDMAPEPIQTTVRLMLAYGIGR